MGIDWLTGSADPIGDWLRSGRAAEAAKAAMGASSWLSDGMRDLLALPFGGKADAPEVPQFQGWDMQRPEWGGERPMAPAEPVQPPMPPMPMLPSSPYTEQAVASFSDPKALLAKYMAAAPGQMQGPTANEGLMRWLAGIGQSVDSREPLGVNLLRMASGGAGGMAATDAERRQVANSNQQMQDRFRLGGVELERASGEARAKELLSAAALGDDNARAVWQGEMQQRLFEQQMRAKHPLAGLLGGAGGGLDAEAVASIVPPKDMLLLAMSKPGMREQLEAEMKKQSLSLMTIIGLDNADRANMLAQKVLSTLSSQAPDAYRQLQAEALTQYALRKAWRSE